ncbi:hypothetical protein [Microbacterium sp. YY-01]|uniref:hypothetical protein n=1 Tax=Microbacterium sp. YY-01 TaxID=3421634 RepID=UPI003D174161
MDDMAPASTPQDSAATDETATADSSAAYAPVPASSAMGTLLVPPVAEGLLSDAEEAGVCVDGACTVPSE